MELSNIIPDLGAGGIIGFVIGFAAKIIIKIAIAFLGVYFASLVYLHHRGIITIHEEALKGTAGSWMSTLSGSAQTIISLAPFGGGFAAGFYIGFRKF